MMFRPCKSSVETVWSFHSNDGHDSCCVVVRCLEADVVSGHGDDELTLVGGELGRFCDSNEWQELCECGVPISVMEFSAMEVLASICGFGVLG